MAWYDFINRIRQDEEDEVKRPQNRVFGFLDDVMDVGGRAGNAVRRQVAPITRGGDSDYDVFDVARDLPVELARATPKALGIVGNFGADVLQGTARGAFGLYRSAREVGKDSGDESRRERINEILQIPEEERRRLADQGRDPNNKDSRSLFLRMASDELGGDLSDESLHKRLKQITQEDEADDDWRADNSVERFFFGSEEGETAPTTQKRFRDYERSLKGNEQFSGAATPLAFAGALGMGVLDAPTGLGSTVKGIGAQAIKQIAKEGGEEAIENILKKQAPKLADDVRQRLIPILARETDEKAIRQVLQENGVKVKVIAKTPGEAIEQVKEVVNKVPGVKGPEKKVVNTGMGDDVDDLLSSMHSSTEIKDMTMKKSWKDKLNESLFDRNQALSAFNESYKAQTGKNLPVADDPKALAQLTNGMNDVAMQKLQPVIENLSKAPNLDAVKALGVARQIEERADSMPVETVEKARRAISQLQNSLGKDFSKVDETVKGVVDHQRSILEQLNKEGILSDQAFDAIANSKQNYFSRFNIVSHMLDDSTPMWGNSKSMNLARQNVVKAIKGIDSDEKFQILDPVEAMVKATFAAEKAIQNNRVFQSVSKFRDIDPNLVRTVKDADETIKRISLLEDNQALRPIRDSVKRTLKSDERNLRRIIEQVWRLEREGMNTALRRGGQTPMPNFIPRALGGDVPTTQAGRGAIGPNQNLTEGEEGLLAALGIKRNPSMLGPQDTARFVKNLIEGPPARLAQIRKMIDARDQKSLDLLGNIEGLKGEFDDVASMIRANSDEAKEYIKKQVPEGYEVIQGYRNGIKEMLAVPREIQAAYTGKNAIQRSQMDRIFNGIQRVLKESVTTLSVPFTFWTNPIRDARQTALTSQYIPKKDVVAVIPYAKRWVGGLIEGLRGGEVAQAVAREGGGSAGIYNDFRSPEEIAKDLSRKVQGRESIGKLITSPKELMDEMKYVGTRALRGVRDFGRAIEYAPRLAEAKAAKAAGATDKEAALAARKVTVDFQEGGRVAQVLNNYLTFLNTRLQGNANVVRGIKRDPVRAGVIIASQIATPVIAGYAWNQTMFPDVMKELDQDVQDRNFVIIYGREKDAEGNYTDILKIPKNDLDRVFANMLENGLRAVRNEDPKSFERIAKETLGNTLPVDLFKEGEFSPSRAVGSALPPALRVPVEAVTGHNLYFDSPVVPEGLADLPKEEQYRVDNPNTEKVEKSTSKLDRFIAAALPGEQSPLKIENARRGLTGNLLTDDPAASASKTVTGGRASRPTTAFYNIVDNTSESRASASKRINEAIANGDMEAARNIAEEHNAFVKKQFTPWVRQYRDVATGEQREIYEKQKINLSTRSINQRRRAIEKDRRSQ